MWASAAGGVDRRDKGENAEMQKETADLHKGNTSRGRIESRKVDRNKESTPDGRPTQIRILKSKNG